MFEVIDFRELTNSNETLNVNVLNGFYDIHLFVTKFVLVTGVWPA